MATGLQCLPVLIAAPDAGTIEARPPDGFVQIIDPEERIGPFGHGDGLVPQPLGNQAQFKLVLLQEPAAAGPPQIMPADILDAGPSRRPLEPLLEVLIGRAIHLAEHIGRYRMPTEVCKDLQGSGCQWNDPWVIGLGLDEGDLGLFQIDLLPLKLHLLGKSEPRLDGEDDHRAEIITGS